MTKPAFVISTVLIAIVLASSISVLRLLGTDFMILPGWLDVIFTRKEIVESKKKFFKLCKNVNISQSDINIIKNIPKKIGLIVVDVKVSRDEDLLCKEHCPQMLIRHNLNSLQYEFLDYSKKAWTKRDVVQYAMNNENRRIIKFEKKSRPDPRCAMFEKNRDYYLANYGRYRKMWNKFCISYSDSYSKMGRFIYITEHYLIFENRISAIYGNYVIKLDLERKISHKMERYSINSRDLIYYQRKCGYSYDESPF